ncbi:MAG: AI-2E family transporter [Lachnospiraceae bacterium]|nr:AI-2E family transporter [Lachnospiraceae bacterium]
MKKMVLIVVITVAIYLSFRFLLPLVVPFVIASVVSLVLYPLLRKIYRNSDVWEGRKKKWLLALSVVGFYAFVLIIFCMLFRYLFDQCESIWLNLPFYQAKLVCVVQDCCLRIDSLLRMDRGVSFGYVEAFFVDSMPAIGDNSWTQSVTEWIPKVTTYSVQAAGKLFGLVFEIIVTVMATFFLIQDYEKIRGKMIQTEWGKCVCHAMGTCRETVKAYLKAQGLIMLLDGILCTLAFLLIGQPYYLVLGPLVAVADALPVLGAGLFLIPYAIFLLISGEIGKALVVGVAYVGCVVIRQTTEPKMIGSKTGLPPILTLLSMYVGFQLFGVIGFILGPAGVLIGMELYRFASEKVE